ncbi:6801_t:CDS:2, partial [Ambispora gerdemannii]
FEDFVSEEYHQDETNQNHNNDFVSEEYHQDETNQAHNNDFFSDGYHQGETNQAHNNYFFLEGYHQDETNNNRFFLEGYHQNESDQNPNNHLENVFANEFFGADILIAAASAAPFGRETNLSEEYISQNAKIEELDDSSKLNGNDNDNVQTFIGHNKKFAHLKKTIFIHYKNGHCKHGNKCRYIHERSGKESQSKHEAKSQQSGNLLRMLIEKEIQKERNILLQSIRYIVDKNFFQIVSNDSLEAAKRRKGPAIEELQND